MSGREQSRCRSSTACPAAPRRSARAPCRCRWRAWAAASVAPLASRLNCMKTRFQISSQRSHSQAGPRHGRPGLLLRAGQWSPWWKCTSEQGPQGPVSPIAQKLSFSPRRRMRSSVRPGHLLPELEGLVVVGEDGGLEPVLGRARDPAVSNSQPKRDRVLLEVVAEGEVAQHLEERVVPRGAADVLEVVVLAAGAHALLGGGGPRRSRGAPRPRNTPLNCTMPALVKSRVGSWAGTSGRGAHHGVPVAREVVEEPLRGVSSRSWSCRASSDAGIRRAGIIRRRPRCRRGRPPARPAAPATAWRTVAAG